MRIRFYLMMWGVLLLVGGGCAKKYQRIYQLCPATGAWKVEIVRGSRIHTVSLSPILENLLKVAPDKKGRWIYEYSPQHTCPKWIAVVEWGESPQSPLTQQIHRNYLHRWQLLTKTPDYIELILKLLRHNKEKGRDVLRHLLDLDKFIDIRDIAGLFTLDISWQKRWNLWESFKKNYKVKRTAHLLQTILHQKGKAPLMIYQFQQQGKQVTYRHQYLGWFKKGDSVGKKQQSTVKTSTTKAAREDRTKGEQRKD